MEINIDDLITIQERNEGIARFLGYKYVYTNVWEDLSDIGGLESQLTLFSKVPLYIETIEDQNYISKDEWYKIEKNSFIFVLVDGIVKHQMNYYIIKIGIG